MANDEFKIYRGTPAKGQLARIPRMMVDVTNTNPRWAQMIFLAMMATFVPDAYIVVDERKVRLNMWVLFLAPPAQYRKSTPLNAFPKAVMPMLETEFTRRIMFPSTFTTEGVCHALMNQKEDERIEYKGLLQIKDEYSTVLKERQKDYKADILENLILLYDGIIESSWTVSHGAESGGSIYLNVLAATTPKFFARMGPGRVEDFIEGGLGTRFTYIYKGPIPPYRPLTHNDEVGCLALVAEIRNLLETLDSYRVDKISVGPEAHELFNEYGKHIYDLVAELNKNPDKYMLSGYLDRQLINAHKLAALHCINRHLGDIQDALEGNSQAEVMDEPIRAALGIELYDVQWAIGQVEERWADFQEMIADWQNESVASEVTTIDRHRKKIIAYISKSPDGIIRHADLQLVTRIRFDTLQKVIKTMEDGGELFVFKKENVKALSAEIKEHYGLNKPGKPSDLYSLEPFPFDE